AGDPDVHTGGRSAEQVRLGHVVPAVAEERQCPAGRTAEPLPDGQQVGQQLARVVAVGQRVDHRDGGGVGDLGEPLVAVGAQHDGGHVAGQHAGRVGQRLTTTEVGGLGV